METNVAYHITTTRGGEGRVGQGVGHQMEGIPATAIRCDGGKVPTGWGERGGENY